MLAGVALFGVGGREGQFHRGEEGGAQQAQLLTDQLSITDQTQELLYQLEGRLVDTGVVARVLLQVHH